MLNENSISGDSDQHDFFVSYARADDSNGWISGFVNGLLKEHKKFAGDRRDLNPFFDKHVIPSGADWQDSIQKGIAQSRLFLAFISPNYFASEWCRKEWHEWVDTEIAKHILTLGVRPIYIIEVPGFIGKGELSEREVAQKIAEFCNVPVPSDAFLAGTSIVVKQVRRRNFSNTQVQSFYDSGVEALRREDLRAVLTTLAKDLDEHAERVREAAKSQSTVPPYNRRFSGRLEELLALRHRLKDDRSGVISGVHGLGGIGKTELAFTYAHAFASAYPGGRFLISCEGWKSLQEAVLSLDQVFRDRILDDERKKPESLFGAIFACLQDRLSRFGHVLLVLDNVDNALLLASRQTDCLTKLGPKLHLLATTRLAPPPEMRGCWLMLGELPESDALDMLAKHRPFSSEAEREAGRRIVMQLGGFTLAIELVAAWLRVYEHSSDYLELERKLDWRVLEQIAAEDAIQLRRHNERRLALILGPVLESLSPPERRTLEYAAMLPPDTVPLPWLKDLVIREFPDLTSTDRPSDPWREIVERLMQLGIFIRVASESSEPCLVRIHRLLQETILHTTASPTTADLWFRLSQSVCLRIVTIEPNNSDVPPNWELTSLFDFLMLAFSGRFGGQTSIAHAGLKVAQTLFRRNFLPAARDLAQRVIEPLSVESGPSSTETLSCLNLLGMIYICLGDYRLAEQTLSSAREKCETLLSSAMLPTTLNNLAMVFYETNRLPQAEELLRRAIQIDEKRNPKREPALAKRFSNLSTILRDRNEPRAALGLAIKALRINRGFFGATDPSVAADLRLVASLFWDLGRTTSAQRSLRKAISIDRSCLPEDHPQLSDHLSELALMIGDSGDLHAAEAILSRVLTTERNRLRTRHPSLAIHLNNLAVNLRNQGRLSEALTLQREALDIELAFRDSDHPKIALRHTSLATTLMMVGEIPAARAHLTTAWQSTRKRKDLLGLRILAIRFVIALLSDEPRETYLGQFKTLFRSGHLSAERIDRVWRVQPVLSWLYNRTQNHLGSLAGALLEAAAVGVGPTGLSSFEEWNSCADVSLDQNW